MKATAQRNWRRTIFSMIGGALFGWFGIKAFVRFGGGADLAELDTARLILAGLGLIFGLMGVLVGLGTLLPAAGAKVLNVSDADELRDERAVLLGSSVANLALSGMLIAIAWSGPGGRLSDVLTVSALAFGLTLATLITALQWRRYDELLRQVSAEASMVTFAVLMPVLVTWATLAHIGWSAPLDPLGVIALVMGVMLVSAFVVAGFRGMLSPR